MKRFSAIARKEMIREMCNTSVDLLIIGGGITGAGIALDAVSRGLKVALIEMQDFASGTSGRSTKLIHGGLRYLKQLEFKLVAEVGKEREIIHRIAPHLTKPEPMLLPIVRNGSMGKLAARLGMTIYEWLAGVKRSEKHTSLTKDGVVKAEPLLKQGHLLGGILFYEYRTDDARLTMEVLKEAVDRGALAVNYMKAIAFIYSEGRIAGVHAKDQLTDEEFEIRTKYIVNAAGPWVDAIDDLEKETTKHKLHITKGVHLVVDQRKLPVQQSVYFDTYDKRMIFVIPRDGKTYIGTTDTFYDGKLEEPGIIQEDKKYLLKCVNDFFPSCKLTEQDIESGWAGLRPLVNKPGKGPSEISRKDEVFISSSGLLIIAGGKLTGYRKMAQRVVDLVAKKMQNEFQQQVSSCQTDQLIISGGRTGALSFSEFLKARIVDGVSLGLETAEAKMLIQRYGSNIYKIFANVQKLKAEESKLPITLRAQLLYAVEHESCCTPLDFFIRRTSMFYFNIQSVRKYANEVIVYMQHLVGFSEQRAREYSAQLQLMMDEFNG